MNFLKRWPVILVSFFFITSTVQAGFLIEPYVGYGFRVKGEDPNVVSGTDTEVTYNGFDVGMRLGFRMSYFTLGIDGDYMSHKVQYEDVGRVERQKYNYGAFAGLIFGEWSFRATWYWQSTWKFKGDELVGSDSRMGSNSSYKTNGQAFGVGVGWQFMKYFAVNVDYRQFYYDELGGVDVEKFVPGEMVISFSLPFDLGKMLAPKKHKDFWD